MIFQSSRSLRTATSSQAVYWVEGGISILAVLADRDPVGTSVFDDIMGISILAVLADRDNCVGKHGNTRREFQSSRSLRTATPEEALSALRLPISILAVLADRDSLHAIQSCTQANFNPRGPCGPRQRHPVLAYQLLSNFNPRGPCGPRPASCRMPAAVRNFNPRGPCGPRRQAWISSQRIAEFQSSRSLRTATSCLATLERVLR